MKKVHVLLVAMMITASSITSCSKDYFESDQDRHLEDPDRCAALTSDNTRCKRNVEQGSIYCWQHK